MDSTQEQDLVAQNQRLLDELEQAYRQLEFYMTTSKQEREIAYRELEARNRQLDERLRELKQAYIELREAENKLVHSAQLAAMGELSASIVHELRNPLGVIQGRTELLLLLKEQGKDDSQSLKIILQETARLQELVNNILSFSRQQEVEIQWVDVNAVLKDLFSFLTDLKPKSVEIEANLEEELPSVYADPNRLQQVFMNLLMNAFDVMPDGGQVKVDTRLTDKASILEEEKRLDRMWAFALEEPAKNLRWLCVAVSDQGDGIPEDGLGRIFEAFFTTKKANKGTGLGLSICRSIIEKLKGNLVVASKPGAGTRFYVLLPLEKEKMDATVFDKAWSP